MNRKIRRRKRLPTTTPEDESEINRCAEALVDAFAIPLGVAYHSKDQDQFAITVDAMNEVMDSAFRKAVAEAGVTLSADAEARIKAETLKAKQGAVNSVFPGHYQ